LRVFSPQAQSVFRSPRVRNDSDLAFRKGRAEAAVPSVEEAWLDLQLFDSQPLTPTLSGLSVGYRIIQLYSQTSGRQTAKFTFALSQGTQDVGSRYEIAATFSCTPARNVSLRVVRDEDARPTTAAFVFRDAQRRVYQLQAKRLPPDFGFHPQGYRADGDTIRLPDGEFEIEFRHEPESIAEVRRVTIDPRSTG